MPNSLTFLTSLLSFLKKKLESSKIMQQGYAASKMKLLCTHLVRNHRGEPLRIWWESRMLLSERTWASRSQSASRWTLRSTASSYDFFLFWNQAWLTLALLLSTQTSLSKCTDLHFTNCYESKLQERPRCFCNSPGKAEGLFIWWGSVAGIFWCGLFIFLFSFCLVGFDGVGFLWWFFCGVFLLLVVGWVWACFFFLCVVFFCLFVFRLCIMERVWFYSKRNWWPEVLRTIQSEKKTINKPVFWGIIFTYLHLSSL